jgi:hypothetical protein
MIVKFRVGEQENQVEAHLRRATREKREAQLRSDRRKKREGHQRSEGKSGRGTSVLEEAREKNQRGLTWFFLVCSVVLKNSRGIILVF